MTAIARPGRSNGAAPRIRSALACLAGVLLLFACGGGDEPASEMPEASGSQAASAGRRAAPQPDETGLQASLGADTRVPDDFPADVPAYPGAIPTASMSAAGEGTLVTFDSNDAPQLVFDFYEEKLVDAGWTIESSATMGDQWMLSAFKGDRNTRISIAAAPAGSQIGVAVARAE